MPFTYYVTNKNNEFWHGKTAMPTMPTAYIGLSTTTPALNGSGITEPSGNGYARVATAAADWGTSTNGAISNVNAIALGTPTGAGWGTVTYVFAADSATSGAGNVLWYASLGSKVAAAGVPLYIPVGEADTTNA